jgi:hypothetical protein
VDSAVATTAGATNLKFMEDICQYCYLPIGSCICFDEDDETDEERLERQQAMDGLINAWEMSGF